MDNNSQLAGTLEFEPAERAAGPALSAVRMWRWHEWMLSGTDFMNCWLIQRQNAVHQLNIKKCWIFANKKRRLSSKNEGFTHSANVGTQNTW